MSTRAVAWLSLLASALLVGQAQAADAPLKAKAPPALTTPTSAYTWTGLYAGVNVGLGAGQYNYPFTAGPVAGSATLQSSGVLGGGQIGYNYQFAPLWVAGVETDIQGSNIRDTVSAATNFGGGNAGTQLNYFGTLRGRVGYLVTPNMLLYATGGWAYGGTTSSVSGAILGFALSGSFNDTQSGWTVGGGLEYAFNNWISAKAEYLYLDLGTNTITSGTLLGVPFTLSEHPTVHTLKVGLNFKLEPLIGH